MAERPDIPDELQDIVGYGRGRRLLVAEAHVHDPQVQSFQARLEEVTGENYQIEGVDVSELEQTNEADYVENENVEGEETEILKDVRRVLQNAVDQYASDIHIEVGQQQSKLRYRIHGDLKESEQWTRDHGDTFCRALYTSLPDVAETSFQERERQDARIRDPQWLPDPLNSIRVATSPTTNGYMLVMRLFYEQREGKNSLSGLGYSDSQAELINTLKEKPTGMNIVSGPTGSGKSTTLKVILSNIIEEHGGRINVLTVENPPEYPIRGTHQLPVTSEASSSDELSEQFDDAIRTAMRLDPDVMMIGEIRGEASARLAMRAAMTGHQVWTTLHANSALEIVQRLQDLGLAPSEVGTAAVFTGSVYQRLVRVLCTNCRKPYEPGELPERFEFLRESSTLYKRGDGCPQCNDLGIQDRTVISETFAPDEEAYRLIREERYGELRTYWRDELNGQTIMEDAFERVRDGICDPVLIEESVGKFQPPGDET